MTAHRDPNGAPRFTNRLEAETSPYLLQHAHNPVDWYPWGEEAFARARAEQKPLFLSVGYSTCHWCHVMERESFEDLEIAALLNRHYVCVKVDREELPHVDDAAMAAVQALNGHGGWPMTLVLTGTGEPFFAATYIPARDGDRGGATGLLTILSELARAYDQEHEAVVRRARQITSYLQRDPPSHDRQKLSSDALIETAVDELEGIFDAEHGGFGSSLKFPQPALLDLLLWHHHRTGRAQSVAMVTSTISHMARGGICDQIGGGFHRYATDRRWRVPHFEKMLYDNAQLLSTFLAAYQQTGLPELAELAATTLAYLDRELGSPEGGFFSATDADSPAPDGGDGEGLFFTWTPTELTRALDRFQPESGLGDELAPLAMAAFGIEDHGPLDGRSVAYRAQSDSELATAFGLSVADVGSRLDAARRSLYRERATRAAPGLDDKIIVAWNALAISALARASFVLNEPAHLSRAERAASFILEHQRDSAGRLLRVYCRGCARHLAYLDDYACFIAALLDLHALTGATRWLEEAWALQAAVDRDFWDEAEGGYFRAGRDHDRLYLRDKPTHDGAEPCGNAVAARNALRWAELTLDERHRQRAIATIEASSASLHRAPLAATGLLVAASLAEHPRPTIVIAEPPDVPARDLARGPLAETLRTMYLPGCLVLLTNDDLARSGAHAHAAVLEGKVALQGDATAYVCDNGTCLAPTRDPRELRQILLALLHH